MFSFYSLFITPSWCSETNNNVGLGEEEEEEEETNQDFQLNANHQVFLFPLYVVNQKLYERTGFTHLCVTFVA